MADKTYQQGMVDAIKLWGSVCGKQGSCADCSIGCIRGVDMTCQEFGEKFPAKMLSNLMEMNKGHVTYYEEYSLRFPTSDLNVEDLAACACRKAIFDGDFTCTSQDENDCIECWKQNYIG